MKLFHVIVCSFGLCFVCLAFAGDGYTAGAPPEPNGQTPGRFQLIAAPVDTAGPRQNMVFRIDTATGQVWKYLEADVKVNVPNRPDMKLMTVNGWSLIGENIGEQVKKAQELYPLIDSAEMKRLMRASGLPQLPGTP